MNTMNPLSNSVPNSSVESASVAFAAASASRPFYWSVRREFWENRSLYIAPLAAAGLFLIGFLISLVHFPGKVRAAASLDSMQQQHLIERPYNFAGLLLMGTYLIIAIFYCLDALHGERRDRSILFWKSLPVSDVTTVLSKASIPLLFLPLLIFAITLTLQYIMIVLSSLALLASGMSIGAVWTRLPFFQMALMLLFHLIAAHSLFYAPIYAWLLLVSAWARRAPFLWAFLPLFAIGVVEKIAFNTTHFGKMLASRFAGGPVEVPYPGQLGMHMHWVTFSEMGIFLSSPGLWVGLALAAAFLALAVRLRRNQGPV